MATRPRASPGDGGVRCPVDDRGARGPVTGDCRGRWNTAHASPSKRREKRATVPRGSSSLGHEHGRSGTRTVFEGAALNRIAVFVRYPGTTESAPMLIRNINEMPLKPVEMPGVKGAEMAVMVGRQDGAPNFALRQFKVDAGGYTPRHAHDYEHEVFIVEGGGTVLLGGEER